MRTFLLTEDGKAEGEGGPGWSSVCPSGCPAQWEEYNAVARQTPVFVISSAATARWGQLLPCRAGAVTVVVHSWRVFIRKEITSWLRSYWLIRGISLWLIMIHIIRYALCCIMYLMNIKESWNVLSSQLITTILSASIFYIETLVSEKKFKTLFALLFLKVIDRSMIKKNISIYHS